MSDDTTDIYTPPVRSDVRVDAMPLPAASEDEYDKILAMTKRLFPGPIEVRHESDPEIADYKSIVVNVVARGSFDDILSRDSLWHRELAGIAAQSSNIYCLAVDIQDET